MPYVSCIDIGTWAALAFEAREAYLGKVVPLMAEVIDAAALSAALGAARGGAKFSYRCLPPPHL